MPAETPCVKVRQHKQRSVLALDTAHRADSLEGLRLVKASRGSGWLWRDGRAEPWETRGVFQDDGQLVIWGESSTSLEGLLEASWELSGHLLWAQVLSFTRAWCEVQSQGGLEGRFEGTSVFPLRDGENWAWAFVPRDLATVLSSVLPPAQRKAWSSIVLPEGGPSTWAFASASLLWRSLEDHLPWEQEDEAFERQEMRELGRTLNLAELPQGLDAATSTLWLESLGTKPSAKARSWPELAQQWSRWTASQRPAPTIAPRQAPSLRSRQTSRRTRQFWRRRGTVVLVGLAATLTVVLIVGSIVWGIVKPDPSDTWTPQQVVQGYYAAVANLDAAEFRKLVQADRNRYPDPYKDEDLTSNMYVLVQVRVSYERKSPLITAPAWVAAGKPPLELGQLLFGITDLVIAPTDDPAIWTADYTRWSQATPTVEGQSPGSLGDHFNDRLSLQKTWKGWKITALVRAKRPLP